MEIEAGYQEENDRLFDDFLHKLERIRKEEFEIHQYDPDPFEKKEVIHRELKMEMRDHQKNMRKQVMINRNRSARTEFVEVETVREGEEINILEDDIFEKVNVEEKSEMVKKEKPKKKNIESMTQEEIEEKIKQYCAKKNIKINGENEKKLREIINNEQISWKKQITILNEFGDIGKIQFIKKNDYGDVTVHWEEEKILTKEERDTQERRRKMLKKFQK